MIFLILTFFTIIFTIVLGIRKKYASVQPKKYFLLIFITSILISLISGIVEGTTYSHGIDIPWWIFSVVSFIIILMTAIILIGLMKIKL